MFNIWSNTNCIPFFVKMGTITSIPKCKNADSPDKYRPITLLPIVYKVYERLILWQLNDYNVEQNIHTLQGGFRKKRGVLEQLGTLRIISETCVKNKKPLYTVCLDIKKAYDSVWRDAILFKLHNHFSVPIPILALIQNMLSNTYSAVCNNHYIYNPFNTTLGVVQGSVISPLLYAVFVNDLITELDDSNQGIHIGKFHIPCLLYCDDIILTSNNLSQLKKLLQICENHSKLWNYQFNPKKCNLITHNIKNQSMTFLDKQYNIKKNKNI